MGVSKILKLVSFIIAVVAVYFFVQVSTNGDGDSGDAALDAALNGAVGGFINFAKILLYFIAAIIIVFIVLDIVKHPKKIKSIVIGLVAFAVLFGIALVLSKSDRIETSTEVFEAGSKLTKNVGTGIWLSFILGIVAFGGFIFDSVKSLLK